MGRLKKPHASRQSAQDSLFRLLKYIPAATALWYFCCARDNPLLLVPITHIELLQPTSISLNPLQYLVHCSPEQYHIGIMSDLRSKSTVHGRVCKILPAQTTTLCFPCCILNPCNYPCTEYQGKLLSLILPNFETSTPEVPDEVSKIQTDSSSDFPPPAVDAIQHRSMTTVVKNILPSTTSENGSSATCVYVAVPKSNRRRRWSRREQEKLIEAVPEHGTVDWKAVSSYLKKHKITRTPKQCRERYRYQDHPRLDFGDWTSSEDKALCELFPKFPGKWAEIGRDERLHHRSPLQIRNRWTWQFQNRNPQQ